MIKLYYFSPNGDEIEDTPIYIISEKIFNNIEECERFIEGYKVNIYKKTIMPLYDEVG